MKQPTPSTQPTLATLAALASQHSAGAILGARSERPTGNLIDLKKEPAAYLTWKGYRVIAVTGAYLDNRTDGAHTQIQETSYFVVNPKVAGDDGGELENLLGRLARHFGLDAVASIRNGKLAIIHTQAGAESPTPERQQMDFDTSRLEAGLYFSAINGHSFPDESMSTLSDITTPQTINGIRARDIIAQRVDQELSQRQA